MDIKRGIKMIILFEFPVIAFAILIFGVLGVNLAPILTTILSISLIISVLWLFFADHKLLNLLVIAANVAMLFFLDGKNLCLWDFIEWLF